MLPGGFEIAARTTYDHVSDGMICSVRELGVGDDHAGILVLGADGGDVPPPGTPAGPVVGLDDVVIELAVTPDRGYCLSMRGIAREMGTGLAADWRDPGAVTPPAWSGEPAWDVRVADPDRLRPLLDDRDGGPRPDRARPRGGSAAGWRSRPSAASPWPSTSPTT